MANLIPMALYIPDFTSKDDLEITLMSEGITYEYISDNIMVCQADADIYEFIMSCRNVERKTTISTPHLETPFKEPDAVVNIPDLKGGSIKDMIEHEEYMDYLDNLELEEKAEHDAAAAAEAAAEAIEREVKESVENPDAESEKARIVENIYRVMHNRKYQSVDIEGICFTDGRNELQLNSIAIVKGKVNVLNFNITGIEGVNKGKTKSILSTNVVKVKAIPVKMFKDILKQINHIK